MVYWLDDPQRPDPLPALEGGIDTDLVVIGGGFVGLWTALRQKERDPDRHVVLLEADRCGHAASGRNGGFCAASLTHGFANGKARWPSEIATLEQMGADNLHAIESAVRRYGIDCGFERTGELAVATEPHQVAELTEQAREMRSVGGEPELFDADGVRALVNSPTYLGGLWDRDGCAMVEPARLAWGLRRACRGLGVDIYEHTPATGLRRQGVQSVVSTPTGTVRARRVALATNAYPSLLRRTRLLTVPVYDYVLMTEPLSAAQRESVAWRGRQGVGDTGNQFHYYRLTRDDRILWGGYDAVYYYGSRLGPDVEQRHATFQRLSQHFFTTFPQLEGLRFTHSWGGAIDTCTRFCAFYGTAMGGSAAYAAGFTGLGVGASRFAADVMLDLVDGRDTPRARLRMVRRRPVPFPPEPLRYGAIQLTRWSLGRADRNDGRRNLWLKLLDGLGLGFDS